MDDCRVILNFHGVGPVPRVVDDGERAFWLDLEHFVTILDHVANQRHVFLTFDDGNISDVELVMPALLQRGLVASFFVCVGHLESRTFMNREHIRYLHANGMRIGTHGMTHRPWRGLTDHELAAELSESRRELEDICGVPVLEAACPFGSYDRYVLMALRKAGYSRVYTSDGGWTSSSFWVQARNTVERSHTVKDMTMLVQRKPHWLSRVLASSRQLVKRLR